MRSIKDVLNDPQRSKVLKWFGAFAFIIFMYALFSDFGLLAALVLIYTFII